MHLRKSVAAALIVCLTATQIGWLPLECAAGSPTSDLKQIQYKQYFRGKYAQAIESLTTYLARTDLEPGHVEAAREFLAASHVLSGSRDRGRDVFLLMLNEDPLYAGPDAATFKASVVGVWAEARDLYASNRLRNAPMSDSDDPIANALPASSKKPIYKKWWFYAGIAAVVVIAGSLSNPSEEAAPVTDSGTVVVGVTVR